MKEIRIYVTNCPKCGATCVLGHDEDFQVYCAHCHTSFKSEKEYSIGVDEYRARQCIRKEYFTSGGWEAFYKP